MISATSALCGLETMPMVFLAEVPMVKGRLYRIRARGVYHETRRRGENLFTTETQRHRENLKQVLFFSVALCLCGENWVRTLRRAGIPGYLRLRGLGIRLRWSRWRREIAPWLELFLLLAAEYRDREQFRLCLRARGRLRTEVLPAQLIRV